MIAFLPAPVRGAITLLLMVLNSVFWCTLFIPLALLKLWPHPRWRRGCTVLLLRLADGWVTVANAVFRGLPIEWELEVPEGLRRDRSYVVIVNHRTWADIPVLLQAFDRRIPFPVFYVKKELLWLPFLGFGMWALDFPFVERYPREVLERRPELRGRDLEAARRACERYGDIPLTLVIFPEGTRFTREKSRRQGAPFRHLLTPRPGGLAVALSVLGDRLEALLDITIVYPPGQSGFWDFLCGRVSRVGVRVRALPIPADFIAADYRRDLAFRARCQRWIEELWREKDALIRTLRKMMDSRT
jgi:1-acyl-sn-glycerol-3-phosphate acyltransferase